MTKDYNIDLMDENQNSKNFEDTENESHNVNILDDEKQDNETSSKPIHKGMIISEVVDTHPDVIPLLIQNGMHCIGCGASMFETLEEGLMGHGMDDREVDRIVDELNTYVQNIKDNPEAKEDEE
jgi:hybrid cluster-associated redox disulfide protein